MNSYGSIVSTLMRLWLYRSVRNTDRRTRRRKAREARRADQRGIAIQTIVVMAVLLVIAGAVALTLRASLGDTTAQFQKAGQVVEASTGDTNLCEAAGGVWHAHKAGDNPAFDDTAYTYLFISKDADGKAGCASK